MQRENKWLNTPLTRSACTHWQCRVLSWCKDCLHLWKTHKELWPFIETNCRCHRNSDGNTPTIVLDAVGMDQTDIWEEHNSVLVFVFGDVLLKQEINKQEHLEVSDKCLCLILCVSSGLYVWYSPCGWTPDPWGLQSLYNNQAQTSCWLDGGMAMTTEKGGNHYLSVKP